MFGRAISARPIAVICCSPPDLETGEIRVDALEILFDLGARGRTGEGTGQQVLFDGQVLEAMPAFHDLHHAALYQLGRIEPVDAIAAILDAALGDFATLRVQQVGDRLEGGGLARAVRPEERDDAALRHFERNALQHEDHVVVDNLDVVDG
jgi:hypothetical protein